MRVHWKLKLPRMGKCQGDYVFRDRESFKTFLSRASASDSRSVPYEKWNSLDFSRQMALLTIEEHSHSGNDVQILGVWKCATEIIVEVLDRYTTSEVVLPAFGYPWASAAVNCSELPIRFLRRRKAWGDEGLSHR